MRDREKDALESTSDDEVATEDIEKGSSEVMRRLVSIEDSSLKGVLIQQAVKRLQEPLTIARGQQIDTIVSHLQKEAAPVRVLIESASFWKETAQRAQSYGRGTTVT